MLYYFHNRADFVPPINQHPRSSARYIAHVHSLIPTRVLSEALIVRRSNLFRARIVVVVVATSPARKHTFGASQLKIYKLTRAPRSCRAEIRDGMSQSARSNAVTSTTKPNAAEKKGRGAPRARLLTPRPAIKNYERRASPPSLFPHYTGGGRDERERIAG